MTPLQQNANRLEQMAFQSAENDANNQNSAQQIEIWAPMMQTQVSRGTNHIAESQLSYSQHVSPHTITGHLAAQYQSSVSNNHSSQPQHRYGLSLFV